jgi:hypothetical protein
MECTESIAIAAATLSLVFSSSVLAGEPTCEVTQLRSGSIGNNELTVGNPSEGRIVFRPGGGGFVTEDGWLGWKVLWNRLVKGPLHIDGHRIDGDAPPLRAFLASTIDEIGIQPSYLLFPTTGCWKINARIHGEPLSLVVRVEKIGDGPAWRRTTSELMAIPGS